MPAVRMDPSCVLIVDMSVEPRLEASVLFALFEDIL